VAGTTPIETAPVPTVGPDRSGPVTALVLALAALLGTAATTYLAVAGTSLGGTLDGLDLWFYENNPSLTPEALELDPVWLNGSPAIQFVVADHRDGVGTMLVEAGVVTRLFLVRNPDKLDRVGSLVDLTRGGVQGPTRGGI